MRHVCKRTYLNPRLSMQTEKSLIVQQRCSPELVSMQYGRYHHCRGVGKEIKRFPKKRVLKNTLTLGGADVA